MRSVVALAFCMVSSLASIALAWHLGFIGNDFSVFWLAAHQPVDLAYLHRQENPFAYPPTTLFWLQALNSVSSIWAGYFAWAAIWLVGVGLITRKLAGPLPALIAITSPAFAYCALAGQVSGFVGLAVLLAACLGRGFLCGVVLGLAATIKPQIVFMAPVVLIARRDWQALSGFAVGGATVIALALVSFGTQPWLDWIGALPNLHAVSERVGANVASVSPTGFADFLGLPLIPFMLLGAVFGGLLAWSAARTDDPLQLAAVIGLASAIAAPYSAVYDLIAVIPWAASRIARGSTSALLLTISPFGCVTPIYAAVRLLLRDSPPLSWLGEGARIARKPSDTRFRP